ncbi:hypothetical protein [Streptomyces sp. NPDC055105]|uniref:hypothetical protein n=1 Tax=Streptomyces sp. NPDC055105 TaxID=3365719 RepID=UPI0037D65A7A
MTRLPDPHKPTAPQAGQPHIDTAARDFLNSIESVMQDADRRIADEQTPRIPTFYKDPTPAPAIGSALPVAQPGRAPMSQKASDASALMLAGGAGSAMLGAGVSLVMLASGYADPTICAIVFGAPVALALALARVLKRTADVAEAAPPVIHQHYTGTVNHEHKEITSHNKGLISINRNDQTDPRA